MIQLEQVLLNTLDHNKSIDSGSMPWQVTTHQSWPTDRYLLDYLVTMFLMELVTISSLVVDVVQTGSGQWKNLYIIGSTNRIG